MMDRATLEEILNEVPPRLACGRVDPSWIEKVNLRDKHVLIYLLNRLPQQFATEMSHGTSCEITYVDLKDCCYVIKVNPSLNGFIGHNAVRTFALKYDGSPPFHHKWFSKENLGKGYAEIGLKLYDLDPKAFSSRYAQLPELIKRSTARSVAASSRGLTRRAMNFTKPTQQYVAHNVFNVVLQQMRTDVLKFAPAYINSDVFSKIFSLDFLPGSLTPRSPLPDNYLTNVYLSLVDVDLSGQKLYDAICTETTLDTNELLRVWLVSNDETLRRFALTFSPKENVGLAFLDTSELIREAGKQLEEIK
jgi:hypothetical protein